MDRLHEYNYWCDCNFKVITSGDTQGSWTRNPSNILNENPPISTERARVARAQLIPCRTVSSCERELFMADCSAMEYLATWRRKRQSRDFVFATERAERWLGLDRATTFNAFKAAVDRRIWGRRFRRKLYCSMAHSMGLLCCADSALGIMHQSMGGFRGDKGSANDRKRPRIHARSWIPRSMTAGAREQC
ncbi:hypothetical protein BC827DRAFT_1199903 [Russula dissimulans]|nr:hypothetical protein BC827DRAFT_1199903 [Russula dissimulans]